MTSRIQGIIDRLADAPKFSDIGWILDAPVVNLSQSVVDANMRRNLEFQGESGLPAKISRYTIGYCCAWCESLVGDYEYPDVPDEAFQRHDNCNCVIEYTPANSRERRIYAGHAMDNSTKSWERISAEELEARKRYAGVEKKFKSVPVPVNRIPTISAGIMIAGATTAEIINSITEASERGDVLSVDLETLGITYDQLEQLLFNELSRAGRPVTVNIFNAGEFVARKRIG